MNDYHSNDNTWYRHDPPDPRYVRCLRCGGQGGRHDPDCITVITESPACNLQKQPDLRTLQKLGALTRLKSVSPAKTLGTNVFPWLFPDQSQQLDRIEGTVADIYELLGQLVASWSESVQAWTDYATELKSQRDEAVAALTDAQQRASDAATALADFQANDAETDAQALADQAQQFADELAAALENVKNPPAEPDPLPETPPVEETPTEEPPTNG